MGHNWWMDSRRGFFLILKYNKTRLERIQVKQPSKRASFGQPVPSSCWLARFLRQNELCSYEGECAEGECKKEGETMYRRRIFDCHWSADCCGWIWAVRCIPMEGRWPRRGPWCWSLGINGPASIIWQIYEDLFLQRILPFLTSCCCLWSSDRKQWSLVVV